MKQEQKSNKKNNLKILKENLTNPLVFVQLIPPYLMWVIIVTRINQESIRFANVLISSTPFKWKHRERLINAEHKRIT